MTEMPSSERDEEREPEPTFAQGLLERARAARFNLLTHVLNAAERSTAAHAAKDDNDEE